MRKLYFKDKRKNKPSFGQLYIFSHPQRNDLKIGYTTNRPEYRAQQVAQKLGYFDDHGFPVPFKVEFIFAVRNCPKAEKFIHKMLDDYHVEREFFNCTLQEAIKIICYNFIGRDERQQKIHDSKIMKKILEAKKRPNPYTEHTRISCAVQ